MTVRSDLPERLADFTCGHPQWRVDISDLEAARSWRRSHWSEVRGVGYGDTPPIPETTDWFRALDYAIHGSGNQPLTWIEGLGYVERMHTGALRFCG